MFPLVGERNDGPLFDSKPPAQPGRNDQLSLCRDDACFNHHGGLASEVILPECLKYINHRFAYARSV
jgi:hypothetical protein